LNKKLNMNKKEYKHYEKLLIDKEEY